MARGFSKAIIMGNLTRDPEVRTTPSGANVASFSVAVNRTYRDASGNNVDQVSFIECSAWGKVGETVAQYAKKGSGVLVSGRLEQRSWDDKNTGQKRSAISIVVEDFNFLPKAANIEGDFGAAGGSYGSSYGGARSTASNATPAEGAGAGAGSNSSSAGAEVVPEDIPDQVDLGDIPF